MATLLRFLLRSVVLLCFSLAVPLAASAQDVLLIGGGATASSDDQVVINHLTGRGFTVSYQSESAPPFNTADKELIIVSATAGAHPSNFPALASTAIPLMVYESFLMDELGLVAAGGQGFTASTTTIAINPDSNGLGSITSHPLTAGRSGTVTVTSASTIRRWGLPPVTAIVAATEPTDSTHATIFGYEPGAAMGTGNAPARRVGFFMHDNSPGLLTADGLALLNAAVDWLLAPATNQAPVVDAGPAPTGVFANVAAQLDGTIVDDNLNAPVTVAWSKQSGPGAVLFGSASSPDTSVTFDTAGSYTLRLTATDGGFTPFEDLVVEVQATPSNEVPVVSAGADAGANVNIALALQGSVTDDGISLPLTIEWTVQSAPGGANVVFGNASSPTSTATFDTPGSYTLRLTATDGEPLSAFDEVEITVADGPPPALYIGGGATANAFDTTLMNRITSECGLNPVYVGEAAVVAADAVGKTAIFVSASTSGNTTNIATAVRGAAVPLMAYESFQFDDLGMAGAAGTFGFTASQTQINLVASHPLAAGLSGLTTVYNAAGNLRWATPGAAATVVAQESGVPTHAALFVYEAGAAMPGLTAPAMRLGFFLDDGASLNANGLTLFDRACDYLIGNLTDAPPVVDAGAPPSPAYASVSANLDGSVVDDGLGVVTIEWTTTAQPGGSNVVFGTPNGADTSVTVDMPGAYTFQLSAVDGAFPAVTDTVDVTFDPTPTNQAPVANAGPDLATDTASALDLQGSVTDDGISLPLTLEWTVTSAPPGGVVTFGDASSPTSNATFNKAGGYTLRLTADDGDLSHFDEMTVTVAAGPPTILLIGGTATPGASDTLLMGQLEDLGFAVEYVRETVVTGAQALGKAAVLISGTTNSSAGPVLATQLSGVAVPLGISKSFAFDDFGLTGGSLSDDLGFVAGQTSLSILPTNHFLSGGMSGNTAVYTAGANVFWGAPSAAALIAATQVGVPTHAAIFGYEPGEAMVVGTAPARRLGFFMSDNGPGILTPDGRELLEAAVLWLTSPTTNQAPSADAGIDRIAQVGVGLALDGRVLDDGLSTPPLSTLWTVLSTPVGGTVSFGNASDPGTTALFSAPGVYSLQLTATDPDYPAAVDTMNVHAAAGVPLNILYVAGNVPVDFKDSPIIASLTAAGHTVTPIKDSLATDLDAAGRDLVIISGSVASTFVMNKFGAVAVPVITWESFIYDDMGWTALVANTDFGAELNQTSVDVITGHPLAGGLSGNVVTNVQPRNVSWGIPAAAAVKVATVAGNAAKPAIFGYEAGALQVDGLPAPARRVGFFMFDNSADGWTPDARTLLHAAVNWATGQPVNQAPVVDAGADKNGFTGQPVPLGGNVLDDLLAQPLVIQWSVVSQPAGSSVVFGDLDDPDSTVKVNTPGTYVLQLSADDQEFEDVDEMTFTAALPPSNQAPVANAGPDFSGATGMAISLSGSITDDGVSLPLEALWTQLSGPGTVTFGNPTAAATTATFTQPGVYELQLQAYDQQYTHSDTVQATLAVEPPSALFVAAAGPLNAPDAALVGRLEAMGYVVDVVSDTAVTAAQAATKRLVLISASVNSGAVGTKLTNVAVPVIVWESFLFDDLRLTSGAANVEFGYQSGQTLLSIVNPAHPLAGGLSGTPAVFGSAANMAFGQPAASAVVVATIATNATRATIFGYDTGAGMFQGLVAPARRVALFLSDATGNVLSAQGLDLFTAAVLWAAPAPVNQPPAVNAGADGGGFVGVPVTLAGSVVDDGLALPVAIEWTKVSGSGNVAFGNAGSASTTATFDAPDTYVLQLSATDPEFPAVVDEVQITVVPVPPNQAPVVDAGPDTTIPVDTALTLAGSVTDDGFPSGTLTSQWTKQSGLGTVTFGNDANPGTTASFGTPGTYVLELTGDDGEFAMSDTVQVVVTSSPSEVLFVSGTPTPNAADAALIAKLQALGYVVQVADDNGITAAAATDKDLVLISASVSSGAVGTTFRLVPVPVIAWESYVFDDLSMTGTVPETAFGYQAGQTLLSITNGAHPLAAGLSGTPAVFSAAAPMPFGQPAASAQVVATIASNATRAAIFGYDTGALMVGGLAAPARRVGLFVADTAADVLTAQGMDLFTAAVTWAAPAPVNQPPAVNAGTDTNGWVGVPVSLSGSVIDDGRALPLDIEWTVLSGAGNVVFGNANNAATTATFDAADTYVLQLSATDPEFPAIVDQVQVVVTLPPPNQAPVVNAGADATVAIAVPLALSGSVTDDGLPSGSLTSLWSKQSGPGSVTFGNAGSLSTSATFATPGTYVLDLTADDTDLTGSDSLQVVVTAAPRQVLYVAASATPGAADAAAVAKLQALGFEVQVADDNGIGAGAATGKDLVIISASVVSTAVNNAFTFVGVPVVVWEPFLYDNLGLTGLTAGTHYEFLPGQTMLNVTGGVHPLAAGLSGVVTVFSSGEPMPYGVALPSAIVGATAAGNPAQAVIFGYESGATLSGLTAPARRVALFLGDNGPSKWTQQGMDLFAAAVNWAAAPPVNQPPVVSAGADANGFENVALALAGSVIDDGRSLPLDIEWTQLSGPATVVFGNAASPTSSATFPTQGTYELQLSVDDQEFVTTDTVQVQVAPPPPNAAPTVSAGPDSSALVGIAKTLAGSVTDDGISLPLIVAWNMQSGPGTVDFADASDPATTATFSAAGSYVLRLTADDQEFAPFDEVTITVNAAPPAVDVLMIVSNGAFPATSDQVVIEQLEATGYIVTPVGAGTVGAADLVGKDVVLVSESIDTGLHGAGLATLLAGAAIPVVTWEPALYNGLGMTAGTKGTHWDIATGQTTLNVTGAHPLTAGLSGTVQMVETTSGVSWGVPSAGAVVSATLTGNAARATVFSYETGAAMVVGNAPARRVGLWMFNGSPDVWTANGIALFDSAVAWAAGLPVPVRVRVLPLGDSITAGVAANSYRPDLWSALDDDFCAVDFTGTQRGPTSASALTFDRDHEGHSGFRTDQILADLPTYLAGNTPDVAMILLGTNNVIQATSLLTAKADLGAIIDQLRTHNPDVTVLLARIPPNKPVNATATATMNSHISALVTEKNTAQSPVVLVDLFTGFDGTTLLQSDQIHPNAAGDLEIANRFFSILRPVVDDFCQ
jgi:lysophospholipase L1-like esterase